MALFFKEHFSGRQSSDAAGGNKAAAATADPGPSTAAAAEKRTQDGGSGSVHSGEPLVREGKEEKVTRKEKLRRHWKRFWVFYVIGLVVFLAIFLPLFFLKIIPAIIQLIINQTDLPIDGGTIALHSPDEIKVSIRTSMPIPAGIKATLDSTTLSLFNRETPGFSPFVAVPLPEQYLDGPTEVEVRDTIVRISNQTELIGWLRHVVSDTTVDVSMRGDSTISLGALRNPVHIDKTATINGLDNLRGFDLPSVRLVVPAEADGTNIRGQLMIPNRSPFSLGLGNLTWNIWAGDVLLGNVYLENAFAVPGDNYLDFKGVVFLKELLPNIGPILASQAAALGRGNLILGASGNKTEYNGQRIGFFEEVINKQRFTAELPVFSVLMQVVGGFLSPGEGGNGTSALLDVIAGVLGNQTLMDGVIDKLNASRIVEKLNSTDSSGASVVPRSLIKRVQRELARTALKSVVRDFKSGRSKTLWHKVAAA